MKRSLFVWPSLASASVTAMIWFPTLGALDTPTPTEKPLAVAPPAILMSLEGETLAATRDLSPRSGQGQRAMRLPERVAVVFGVADEPVRAPVRREQRELAGMASAVQETAAGSQLDDEMACPPDSPGRSHSSPIVASASPSQRALGGEQLRSLRSRVPIESDPPTKELDPLLAVPSRAEFWAPEFTYRVTKPVAPELAQQPTGVGQPTEKPGIRRSLLPESNRALGRRILASAAPDLAKPTPDATRSSLQIDRPMTLSEPLETSTPPAELAAPERPKISLRVESPIDSERMLTHTTPAGWPVTQRLDEQLNSLSTMVLNQRHDTKNRLVSLSTKDHAITAWSDEVSQRLLELRSLPRLGDPRAEGLIEQLEGLANEGLLRAETLDERDKQVSWLRASFALARRVAVWKPVWRVASENPTPWMIDAESKSPPCDIDDAIEMVRLDLGATGDETGWRQYLLLDEIRSAQRASRCDDRKVLAQRFLSRLAWHGLDAEQQRWLESESITQLADCIRPWTHDVVDYASLMRQIERQETDAIDLAAIEIADAVQTLRFAESAEAVRVATAIGTYYRNANIRIALSRPMLQRMLPVVDTRTVPIHTRILGSQVRGSSQIDTNLQIELVPAKDRWTLSLRTRGNVRTHSTGSQKGVNVRTSGDSGFVATTPIEITPTGARAGDCDVDVRGHTRLRGVSTRYDSWPLIGSLVQSIAENQYHSIAPRSQQIGNQQMRKQIELEVDTQVQESIDRASARLNDLVLGPLGKLRLDPKVTDMRTTDQRLLARYRLAGDWQLAAFTPRPRALSSSLMSIQIHQSALNNTLEQLIPRDQSILIHDLIHDSAELFGQQAPAGEDIPDDVLVRFARTRPVTVEIDEGRVWITLRIVRLTRGERLDLTQFIVRAAYKPQVNGMQASLIRDGHLRISGPRMSMRERLPVRAIFNKVLSPNQTLPLIVPRLVDHPATAGLAVSQLELRGGWLAISISEDDAPRIALAD